MHGACGRSSSALIFIFGIHSVAVPKVLTAPACRADTRQRGQCLYSSQAFCLPRLVVSSLEALESCFAVGPIIEKASYFFKAHGSFLKRQEVGLTEACCLAAEEF